MIHLFEKKPKTIDNKYGIEEVSDKDVFKKGPCIIVILAKTWFLSSINGAMKLVANLVNPDIDENYNPDKRIFGIASGEMEPILYSDDMCFSEDEPKHDHMSDFVDTYLVPLVSNNGKKIDVDEAMRNMRNINFITYCNGSMIYGVIEIVLAIKMRILCYTEEEIKLILSQMCLAAVSGDIEFNNTRATTLLFTDKNDSIDEGLKESMQKCDGYYRFIVDGDGKHDFTKYLQDDPKLSSAIKGYLNRALVAQAPIDKEHLILDDNPLALKMTKRSTK